MLQAELRKKLFLTNKKFFYLIFINEVTKSKYQQQKILVFRFWFQYIQWIEQRLQTYLSSNHQTSSSQILHNLRNLTCTSNDLHSSYSKWSYDVQYHFEEKIRNDCINLQASPQQRPWKDPYFHQMILILCAGMTRT